MKTITTYELANQNEAQLSALFKEMNKALMQTEKGTPERRNALASLENISQVRCIRYMGI